MSELAIELRAIGRAINHEEYYVDAGFVPLTLAQAADRIEALEAEVASLREANQTWADMFGPSAALAPEQDK